ncbi:MAG: amidohydrolase family protein [Myxococcota bacterium]
MRRLTDSKYFEERGGTIVIADDLGPICDVHAHLALTYVPQGNVDLYRQEVASLYLDPERPVDLDSYMNENFSDREMKEMRRDLSVGSLRDRGKRSTHTAPALKQQMNRMGVTHSVILAIDLPHSDLNTRSYVTVSNDHPELLAGAAVHPLAPNAEALLRRAVRGGAKALKMHPAVQMLKPDHPKAMRLYEVCGELGIPVMWHCGPVGIVSARADARCHLKHYWTPIHDLPGTRFILGHSGARQYDMALKLAAMYDNVYLEIASQGLLAVETILRTADPLRIMNGSDFPFYHQGYSILKILEATENDATLRRRVLFENAARLFQLEE